MTVGGIDIGKRQFTIAAIPLGEKRPVPAVVTVSTKIKDPIGAAQMLAGRLRFYLEETSMFGALRSVWLEEPWGKQTAQVRDLSIVLGFLAAQFHSDVAVSTVSPDEWRGKLGLPRRAHQADLKAAAIQYAQAATADAETIRQFAGVDRDIFGQGARAVDWSDHEADAICMALACRQEIETLARESASR